MRYYPFGLTIPGRSMGTSYRYGFNGKEKDKDGDGNSIQYDFKARIYDPHLGRSKSVDPLNEKFPGQSPYCAMDNNPILKTDPTGMAASPPSTIIDGNGKVVGGSTTDGDLGVYKILGISKENFDIRKLASYKSYGTRIGSTISMNTFLNPETNEWIGQINLNLKAGENLLQATKNFGGYLSAHSSLEGFNYYKSNAVTAGIYDIKTWGFKESTGKTWLEASDAEHIKFIYQASFYSKDVIMTRRDEGNFFAGRAMKMTGVPKSIWLSGFGAFQSEGNKNSRGGMFYFKSALNWLDQQLMGSAINGTPMEGMSVKPIFHDDKVSEDLQRAGYSQYGN